MRNIPDYCGFVRKVFCILTFCVKMLEGSFLEDMEIRITEFGKESQGCAATVAQKPERSGMEYPSQNIKAVTEFIFLGQEEQELYPSDLVIVLGNHIMDIMMGEVAGLYERGKISKDAKIILSGANGDLTAGQDTECEQMYRIATETFRMPRHMFLKEDKASNAYENMALSAELIEKNGGFGAFRKILCVGNSFLLRRASLYAAGLGYPMDKLQYYGVWDRDGRNIGPDSWWKSEVSRNRVMAEVERIGKYYATGNMSLF